MPTVGPAGHREHGPTRVFGGARPSAPASSAFRVALAALAPLLLTLGVVHPALADRLQAAGAVLEGTVHSLGPGGVEFEPEFATGSILVPWENVEAIATDRALRIVYGSEGGESTLDAVVAGWRDGTLLVGQNAVDSAAILEARPLAVVEAKEVEASRPSWSGNLEVGANLQQATTDNLGLLMGVRAQREAQTRRIGASAGYRYGTEKSRGNPTSRTQDQISTGVRIEQDFSENWYAYLTGDALYDAVQDLSLRAVPKAGLGYTLWERRTEDAAREFLQIEAGGGWVYERYFGGASDDFFTLAFGLLGARRLPRGAVVDARLDFLPAAADILDDFVLRGEAGLSLPLVASVAARVSLADVYDSTPAPGANKNSLYLSSGLTVGW